MPDLNDFVVLNCIAYVSGNLKAVALNESKVCGNVIFGYVLLSNKELLSQEGYISTQNLSVTLYYM